MFSTILLSRSGYTSADLSANKTIVGNKLTATTLAFSTRNTFNESVISQSFITYGLVNNGFDIRALRIKKEGELASPYSIKTENIGGDDSACKALNVSIMKDYKLIFNGPLNSLDQSSIINDNPDDWIIFINLSKNNQDNKNKSCNFNFVFNTKLNDKPGGFSDSHFITNNITI